MAIKESFDSLYEKATEAAQYAAKKTKKLAEIAKANLSIYAEEDKIKKAQLELGKLYYRDYVLGEEQDEAEYLPWCKRIDESKQTIADMRDYLDELKAERVEMEQDVVDVDDAPEADAAPEAPAEEAPEETPAEEPEKPAEE